MIDAPALGFAVLGVEKPTGLFNRPHVIRHRETTPSRIALACSKTNKKGPSLELAGCRGNAHSFGTRARIIVQAQGRDPSQRHISRRTSEQRN